MAVLPLWVVPLSRGGGVQAEGKNSMVDGELKVEGRPSASRRLVPTAGFYDS